MQETSDKTKVSLKENKLSKKKKKSDEIREG